MIEENEDIKQTILIVDDEPMNINLLSSGFKNKFNIVIAKSGTQAIERLEKETVDLILLDINMPGMNGYSTCKKIKENMYTQNIPIIFITAKDDVEDEATGLDLGAVDYITKPFHLPIVKARVKTHLLLKHKSDLLEKQASIDGLTQIYNRRKFDEMLDYEWKRSSRGGKNPVNNNDG